jgi:hypothetical protein
MIMVTAGGVKIAVNKWSGTHLTDLTGSEFNH